MVLNHCSCPLFPLWCSPPAKGEVCRKPKGEESKSRSTWQVLSWILALVLTHQVSWGYSVVCEQQWVSDLWHKILAEDTEGWRWRTKSCFGKLWVRWEMRLCSCPSFITWKHFHIFYASAIKMEVKGVFREQENWGRSALPQCPLCILNRPFFPQIPCIHSITCFLLHPCLREHQFPFGSWTHRLLTGSSSLFFTRTWQCYSWLKAVCALLSCPQVAAWFC